MDGFHEDALEATFREATVKVVTVLVRQFGPQYLGDIENCYQDAVIRALERWPAQGVPENPEGWLYVTARNSMLNQLRQYKLFKEKRYLLADGAAVAAGDEDQWAEPVNDDMLKLILVCCHPLLALEAQICLTLRVVVGFSYREIAAALLSREDRVKKIVKRAERKLRGAALAFEVPALSVERVASVLDVLYLLFNEGYSASSGDNLCRRELCLEAINLAELVGQCDVESRGDVHALCALMYFHAARLPTRADATGRLLTLKEQDRRRWDRAAIAHGIEHFRAFGAGGGIGKFHLEAAIAFLHVTAPSYDETDWPEILRNYDELAAIDGNPMIKLNREIAFGKVYGPAAALARLLSLADDARLQTSHLFYATLADLCEETGQRDEATRYYRRALDLVQSAPERSFLAERLDTVAI